MKPGLLKTTFLSVAIAIFMFFAVIITHAITQQNPVKSAQPADICINTNSSPCLKTTATSSPTPFIPNQQLNEQDRFFSIVNQKLTTRPQPGTFEYILLRAYGAVFVNQDPSIKLPPKVIFTNELETQKFQSTFMIGKVNGTNDCFLQKAAADALNKAMSLQKFSLRSGHGGGDCTRSFATNLRFWQKYANKQTLLRVQTGKETRILGTVAPPGTSQHLLGLAIDLNVFNQAQRKALNENGWFQTVEYDVPHWTYLSWTPENLPKFGFKNKVIKGISYWLTPI